MAMDDLEIFCFVLEGAPDLWADGYLHRLSEGDGVTLNARTGLAHTLINNTNKDVRLFVMTEAFRRNSKATHPLDPQRRRESEQDEHVLGRCAEAQARPERRQAGRQCGPQARQAGFRRALARSF